MRARRRGERGTGGRRPGSLAAGLAMVLAGAGCARLGPLTADTGRQEVNGKVVRPPYASQLRYFAYVPPGTVLPDQVGGHRALLLHLWLPATTQELGLRVLSQVGGLARPEPGVDGVDDAYAEHHASEVGFTPSLRLERCVGAVNPEDLGRTCNQWVGLGAEEAAEPAPAGARPARQAMLRVKSSNDDPMKVLVRGLYRVVVHGGHLGEVQGTLLVQVGAPGDLPGMHIGRRAADLAEVLRPTPPG